MVKSSEVVEGKAKRRKQGSKKDGRRLSSGGKDKHKGA